MLIDLRWGEARLSEVRIGYVGTETSSRIEREGGKCGTWDVEAWGYWVEREVRRQGRREEERVVGLEG